MMVHSGGMEISLLYLMLNTAQLSINVHTDECWLDLAVSDVVEFNKQIGGMPYWKITARVDEVILIADERSGVAMVAHSFVFR